MLPFLADENFRGPIVRGVRLIAPTLDVVRVQDVGLSGADDPTVLEWSARNGRILLTHDVQTIPRYAYERVEAGFAMPGVLVVKLDSPIGDMVEQILLIAQCCERAEFDGRVRFAPL